MTAGGAARGRRRAAAQPRVSHRLPPPNKNSNLGSLKVVGGVSWLLAADAYCSQLSPAQRRNVVSAVNIVGQGEAAAIESAHAAGAAHKPAENGRRIYFGLCVGNIEKGQTSAVLRDKI